MKTLKTDVIIPAYRPGEEFEKLLERLSAQKYPINKILVMNTEKKFWKETWEQEYPLVEVRHLTKEEFDHGGTRRQAAELSDAEILKIKTYIPQIVAHHVDAHFLHGLLVLNVQHRLAAERLRFKGKIRILRAGIFGTAEAVLNVSSSLL